MRKLRRDRKVMEKNHARKPHVHNLILAKTKHMSLVNGNLFSLVVDCIAYPFSTGS